MKSTWIRNYGFRIATALTAVFLLAAGTSLTASAARASYVQPARTASVTATSAAAGCSYYNADLGYRYFSPVKASGLDWWGRGNTLKYQDTTVVLGRVSGSSNLDCFHPEGGFGNGRIQVRLANSALCLAVSGRQAGTHIVLSNCLTHPISQLFHVYPGLLFESAATGQCIDLSNGFRAGSLLVQKPCKSGDVFQQWYLHT